MMTLYGWAWIGIGFQVLLLLVWLYDTYRKGSHTDAAGRGLAGAFILALVVYIVVSIILLLFHNKYCTIIALCMAAFPLAVVIFGLWRYFKSR